MAEEQNQRSLVFQISNKTQNITLKFHRFDREFHRSPQLHPELPPGLPDCCQISGDPGSPYILRLLVYEAESFTLAIFIRVFQDLDESSGLLHLEVSLDKTHLSDLCRTLQRMRWMLDPPKPDGTSASFWEFSNKTGGCVQLIAGPCRVMATACHQPRLLLKVELEERKPVDYDLEDLESCTIC